MVQEERSLAVRQAAALVNQQPEEEGDYGIAESELRAPFLAWNGKTGNWLDPFTGELSESVSLVLLRSLPSSRIYWNPDLDSTEKMLCRSLDIITPANAEQAAKVGAGPLCEGCRFAAFGKDKAGNTTKSPCSQYANIAVAFADAEEPIPYVVGAKSTSLKPIRAILQQLSWQRIAKRAKGVPGYAIRFTLYRGEPAGKGAMTYFPLRARLERDLVEKDHWPALSALWRVVSNSVIDVTAEAVPDEEEPPEADYGDEPHVMSPDELRAQMNDETRQVRERMQAQRAQPTEIPVEKEGPADCHSLPADPEGEVDESRFEPPVGQAQAPLMDVPAAKVDPVDGRRGRR